MKKLELNANKCHKMHLGGNDRNCPEVHVHDEAVKDVEQDKYLGDVISKDGKIDKNISARI